jgi:4-amino-4-deoxy-L-arabinose transferase-like glycosyltransferase
LGAYGARIAALAALVLGVALWVLANAWWLHENRAGQPRNIDEWGYFSYSLNDYYASLRGGPAGWVQAVLTPSIQSPLTTAVTSLVFFVTGTNWVGAFGVILAAGAGALVACFVYGRRVGGSAVGLLAAGLLAFAPAFIHLSRIFIFAVPATAMTTLAVWALVRARGGRSLPWSITFGILLGLMPLTRTMTISFVPFLAIAAVLQAVVGPEDRGRRVRNVVIAGLVCVGTAAIWLAGSWTMVFGYLFDFGYGKQSAAYARTSSPLLGWVSSLAASTNGVLLLVLAVGVVLLAVVAVLAIRSVGIREWLPSAVASPVFPGALLLLGGAVVLASSQNQGLGFSLPLVPTACVLAASGYRAAVGRCSGRGVVITAAALVVVVGLIVTPSFGISTALRDTVAVAVPGVGQITVLGGQDTDPAYATTVGGLRNNRSLGDDWERENAQIADELLERPGAIQAAFGFRGDFVNVNSVQVALMGHLKYGSALAQIDPTKYGPSVAGYTRWLTRKDAKHSCTLLTSAGRVNEFTPLVDTRNLAIAAKRRGFVVTDRVASPDGRTVLIWNRTNGACAPQAAG